VPEQGGKFVVRGVPVETGVEKKNVKKLDYDWDTEELTSMFMTIKTKLMRGVHLGHQTSVWKKKKDGAP